MQRAPDCAGLSSNRYIYNTILTPNVQGTPWKGCVWRDFKNQRTRKSTERLCILNMTGKLMTSQQYGCLHTA